jgi:hypothetical protein
MIETTSGTPPVDISEESLEKEVQKPVDNPTTSVTSGKKRRAESPPPSAPPAHKAPVTETGKMKRGEIGVTVPHSLGDLTRSAALMSEFS